MKQEISAEEPNVLFLRIRDDWTDEEVREIARKAYELVEGWSVINYLVDLSRMKGIPLNARNSIMNEISNVPHEKIAIFGASTKIRVIGKFLLKVLPQVRAFRFFETEKEARTWLRE